FRDGGRPGDDEKKTEAARLQEILSTYYWSPALARMAISEFLPGLRTFDPTNKDSAVFEFSSFDELRQFEKSRRLGSPSHWRMYFAFDTPSYAIDDAEIANFRRWAGQDHAR